MRNFTIPTNGGLQKLAPRTAFDVTILARFLGQIPDLVIVPEGAILDWFCWEYFSEKLGLAQGRPWFWSTAQAYNAYLTHEIRVLSGAFGRALSWNSTGPRQEKSSLYYLAEGPQSRPWGSGMPEKILSYRRMWKPKVNHDWGLHWRCGLAGGRNPWKAIVKLNVILISAIQRNCRNLCQENHRWESFFGWKCPNLAKISIAHALEQVEISPWIRQSGHARPWSMPVQSSAE